MDNVMNCLMDRETVEIVEEYKYRNLNMILYGQKRRLKDLCHEFKKYEIGDSALLDRLLPKRT
jgi:hypothetical protein